ncbi:MAG TPA: Hsp20/alpha crystallin family protein [Gammaproteobacteria bacterium]|nr:Hsp20/alpha crystallin family protein [Gammaproteobacteria bacterium]
MQPNVVRYDPWNVLNQLQTDLAQLFDNRPSMRGDSSKIATGQWIPAVDIKEESNHFLIMADLPGVKPEDLDVTMENGVMTIKGHRETEAKTEESGYFRIERSSGTFYRRFSLPDTADEDGIKAEFKHGVLNVTIPKKEKVKPRKITVKAEKEK